MRIRGTRHGASTRGPRRWMACLTQGVLAGGVGLMATATAAPGPDAALPPGATRPVVAKVEPTEPTLTPMSKSVQELDMRPVYAGRPPQTMDELRAFESHTRELTESLKKYVVGVVVGPAQGSGVVVSPDGLVLTAAHVNGDDGRDVTFVFPDGSTRRGKTLGLNRSIDSGMMKIDLKKGETLPYVEMGDSDEIALGQWCVALGHPGGYQEGRQPVLRLGRIISNGPSTIRTDCTLVGGDSGGPLFDMDGKLIAIHSRIGMKLSANLHVPVSTYQTTWARLEKGDDWSDSRGPRPYVGFRAEIRDGRVLIEDVVAGDPAAKAGLKSGDVLLAFDGDMVGSIDDIRDGMTGKKKGDKINVEIRRGDETLKLTVVIDAR